jgi:hypothetical protein
MIMRLSSLVALVLALLTANASAAIVTYTTTGVYDPVAGGNSVDTNSSGNAIGSVLPTDYEGFKSAVASAFSAGSGGVIDFDLPNGMNANANSQLDGFSGSFAGGTKTLVVTNTNAASDNQLNHSTFTSIATTSGTRGLLPTNSATTAFRLIFAPISGAGALPGEVVTQAAFTLLSRDAKAQNALVEWFIDGNTVTPVFSDTESFLAGQSTDDTFFSYIAPTGSAITSVRITYDTTNLIASDDRLAIDDLGFITAVPVPEPTTVFLLLGGVGCWAVRRRATKTI